MSLEELSLELPNRPGALAGVARALAKERINLAAVSVDSSRSKGRIRLIVNHPDRARKLLTKAGFKVERHQMLAVHLEDRAGTFLKVLDVLARAKINVQSVSILVAREGAHSLVALSTTDLTKARQVLEVAGFVSEGAERLVTNADLLAGSPTLSDESVGLLL
ncbi:MAG: ACT domain-containing protein [Candidatus Lutacidiplasmatales archaeon]